MQQASGEEQLHGQKNFSHFVLVLEYLACVFLDHDGLLSPANEN
jgi:hypothetical protein